MKKCFNLESMKIKQEIDKKYKVVNKTRKEGHYV